MKLLTIGSAITDEIIQVQRLPRSGEDIPALDSWTELGGCAANVAVTAVRLEVPTAILCRLGADQRGTFIRTQLEREGVDTSHIKTDFQRNSGYCLSLVEQTAERTFITFDGANLHWTQADIPREIMTGYDILYISGYELVEPASAKILTAALQRAAEQEKRIVFDPGPVISTIPRYTFKAIAAISTILILNEQEAADYVERGSLEVLAQDLYDLGPKLVIIKLGARGCYYKNRANQGIVPGFAVQPVDSSGAGDAFAGACVRGLAQGLTVQEMLKLANAVGAMVVAGRGPQGPIPTLVEVMAFMQLNDQE